MVPSYPALPTVNRLHTQGTSGVYPTSPLPFFHVFVIQENYGAISISTNDLQTVTKTIRQFTLLSRISMVGTNSNSTSLH
jgi:hypothetical protein